MKAGFGNLVASDGQVLLCFPKVEAFGTIEGFSKYEVERLTIDRREHRHLRKWFAFDFRDGGDWWWVEYRKAA